MKKRKIKFKAVFIGILVCYLGYIIISQQMAILRIKRDIEKYSAENKRIEEENSYLKDEIEYAGTDEYIEKMARERLGLIKDGETVYVIKDEDSEN